MLPAEIIDFIFSFLQRDRAALTSCSAAHPLLSSLAERHLFVHITIYLGWDASNGFLVDQLAGCLSEKPYLANHIRSITIDAIEVTYYFTMGSFSSTFQELSTLLPLISHSEELILRNVQWLRLSSDLRSALLNFLRTTHMKEISLQRTLYFPLVSLGDLKNIKNLKIDSSRCDFKNSPQLPISTSLEYLSLVDLSVDSYAKWAVPGLSNLISLHVKPKSPNPFPNLSPILNVCSISLTTLTFEIHTLFETAYRRGVHSSVISPLADFRFDLSSLASLELITVHAKIAAHTDEVTEKTPFTSSCDSSLPAITRLISSAGPSLKRAVLDLDCAVRVAPDLRDAMEWGALAQLCDRLAHLRVDLCIRATASSLVPISFVEVVDSLIGNNVLSRLVEQGSLIIKPLVFPLDF